MYPVRLNVRFCFVLSLCCAYDVLYSVNIEPC